MFITITKLSVKRAILLQARVTVLVVGDAIKQEPRLMKNDLQRPIGDICIEQTCTR